MNRDQARDDIHRLYNLFAANEPSELATHIAPISFGQAMIPGTTIPAIGAVEYQQHDSGLFVPVGSMRRTAPIDLVKVFITPDELTGSPLSEDVVLQELERIPLSNVIHFVAETLARWRSPSHSNDTSNQYFARRWFGGKTRQEVLKLLQSPNRSLVAPQALLVLLKMAFLSSSDSQSNPEVHGDIVKALLAVMQNLGTGSEAAEGHVLGDTPGRLGREIISNQLFNSSIEVAGLLARFIRRWIEMPQEYKSHPRVLDLADIYKATTGVSLTDLSIVGLALIAGSWEGRIYYPTSYFENLNWSNDRLSRTLDLISADPNEIREGIRSETATRGMQWAFSIFEQFPLVKLGASIYCLIDSLLLLRRIFGWLPLFDVTATLNATGSKEKKQLSSRFTECVRYLAEQYALEVIQSIVQCSHPTRVYSDKHIQDAYHSKGVRLADCAVDYGDAWLVIEITSSQLTRESVSGVSDEHVVSDLDKLADKVEQIASTIQRIRSNQLALTQSSAAVATRFFPILVVTEGFPTNPITLILLRQKVAERGLLNEQYIAPLEVLDSAELEILEAVQQHHGMSMRDLLDKKSRSGLYQASMRDFILAELQLEPQFSSRINQLWTKAFEPTLNALQEENLTDSKNQEESRP